LDSITERKRGEGNTNPERLKEGIYTCGSGSSSKKKMERIAGHITVSLDLLGKPKCRAKSPNRAVHGKMGIWCAGKPGRVDR